MLTMSPVSCQPSLTGSKHAGFVRLEVAQHDVWSAHEEPAAIGDALDVLQARFDPRQNPAHCT